MIERLKEKIVVCEKAIAYHNECIAKERARIEVLNELIEEETRVETVEEHYFADGCVLRETVETAAI